MLNTSVVYPLLDVVCSEVSLPRGRTKYFVKRVSVSCYVFRMLRLNDLKNVSRALNRACSLYGLVIVLNELRSLGYSMELSLRLLGISYTEYTI